MLQVYGSGRMVAAPEMKHVTSKTTGEVMDLCAFRLASDNDWPSEKSSFIRISAWGARARYVFKAGFKGAYVEFDGELIVPEFDKEKERQYEPELHIGGKGHIRVLVVQKRDVGDAVAPATPDGGSYDDYEAGDMPVYGKGSQT